MDEEEGRWYIGWNHVECAFLIVLGMAAAVLVWWLRGLCGTNDDCMEGGPRYQMALVTMGLAGLVALWSVGTAICYALTRRYHMLLSWLLEPKDEI